MSMEDWVIVSSKSGMTKDGFPCGEILFKDKKDIEEAKKRIHPRDFLVRSYFEFIEEVES